jgi:hypothetical protein
MKTWRRLPSLFRHSAQGRQSCQLYMPVAVYTQGNSLALISVKRLSGSQGFWIWAEGIDHLKISKDPTRNWTRNLVSCGAMPQPTPPLAPGYPPVPWFLPIITAPYSLWLYITSAIKSAIKWHTQPQNGHNTNQIQMRHPSGISHKRYCRGIQPSMAKGHNCYSGLVCMPHL